MGIATRPRGDSFNKLARLSRQCTPASRRGSRRVTVPAKRESVPTVEYLFTRCALIFIYVQPQRGDKCQPR